MPLFCYSNIFTYSIISKGIDLDDLFDKRIVVEKIKIQPTKFPGKNASGMRMQMQVIPDAKFNDEPDEEGDFFVKGENGLCIGTRRSVFTGSDNLMEELQKAQLDFKNWRTSRNLAPKDFIVFDTTITEVGKMFHFT